MIYLKKLLLNGLLKFFQVTFSNKQGKQNYHFYGIYPANNVKVNKTETI
jgi:hypothetical protein